MGTCLGWRRSAGLRQGCHHDDSFIAEMGATYLGELSMTASEYVEEGCMGSVRAVRTKGGSHIM